MRIFFAVAALAVPAPTDGPCYAVPTQANNSVLPFTVQRQPRLKTNRNACFPGNGDVEGIRVSDIYGNGTTQYFANK